MHFSVVSTTVQLHGMDMNGTTVGWFKPSRVVPKYLKNFGKVVFPIALAPKTSLSENQKKILTSRPRPSRQKFYNIAIVLWILMFANFSSQIYKFWAWKLQTIYGKPIDLGKKLVKGFLKNTRFIAGDIYTLGDKILSLQEGTLFCRLCF